nr:hypothetical protein [Tanacetum cinerariifolium]
KGGILGSYYFRIGGVNRSLQIQAMVNWHVPTYLKQLRGFLGLTGYYRRFVKNYASISMPLTALLKKNAFGWNMEAQKAFEKLKSVMTQTPVLQLPDFSKIFIIETDASGIGIGAVLQQKVADALSRVQGQTKCLQLEVTTLSSELYDKVKKGWSEDSQLKAKIEKLQLNSGSSKHYSWSNGELLRNGKLVISNDEDLRKELMEHFHNGPTGGHSGMQATTKRMGALMYWKKMRNQIKQHIRQCDTCPRYKPELVPYLGLLQPLPIPTSVWDEISMDFIDGLPMSKGRAVIMVIVDRLTADLLLWKDKKVSGGILGGSRLIPAIPENPLLEIVLALRIEINRGLAVIQDIASLKDHKKFLFVLFAAIVYS